MIAFLHGVFFYRPERLKTYHIFTNMSVAGVAAASIRQRTKPAVAQSAQVENDIFINGSVPKTRGFFGQTFDYVSQLPPIVKVAVMIIVGVIALYIIVNLIIWIVAILSILQGAFNVVTQLLDWLSRNVGWVIGIGASVGILAMALRYTRYYYKKKRELDAEKRKLEPDNEVLNEMEVALEALEINAKDNGLKPPTDDEITSVVKEANNARPPVKQINTTDADRLAEEMSKAVGPRE